MKFFNTLVLILTLLAFSFDASAQIGVKTENLPPSTLDDNSIIQVQDLVNGFFRNRKATVGSIKETVVPFRTAYGNVPSADSVIAEINANTISFLNLGYSKDEVKKSIGDLVYNQKLEISDFKTETVTLTRLSHAANTITYPSNYVRYNTVNPVNVIANNLPVRYRSGKPRIISSNYFLERCLKSWNYSMSFETYTNADTLLVSVVDVNTDFQIIVGDSIIFNRVTTPVNGWATYAIRIPYKSKGYRLVTFRMSDFGVSAIGIKNTFRMYRPDYEIKGDIGIITDSYGVGQTLMTHIDYLSFAFNEYDFNVNAIGGSGYLGNVGQSYASRVRSLQKLGIKNILFLGGLNNYTSSSASLNVGINQTLDTCNLLNVNPFFVTPFTVPNWANGIYNVHKSVVKNAYPYVVKNGLSVNFEISADNVHPTSKGYYDIYKGLKDCFVKSSFKPYTGLVELSYTPSSATDLRNEALTASIGTKWLLNVSGSWFEVLKVSNTQLARTPYALF